MGHASDLVVLWRLRVRIIRLKHIYYRLRIEYRVLLDFLYLWLIGVIAP